MFDDALARKFAAAPTRQALDAIDLEAERQGNARRYFARNNIGPQVLGRRIAKQHRQNDGNRKTAELYGTRNIVADTAAALQSRRAA